MEVCRQIKDMIPDPNAQQSYKEFSLKDFGKGRKILTSIA